MYHKKLSAFDKDKTEIGPKLRNNFITDHVFIFKFFKHLF